MPQSPPHLPTPPTPRDASCLPPCLLMSLQPVTLLACRLQICHRRGQCCHLTLSQDLKASHRPEAPSPKGWSARGRDASLQIGVHAPTAAAVVGSVRGVDKEGYVCGVCSVNGHEEYECPVKWAGRRPPCTCIITVVIIHSLA